MPVVPFATTSSGIQSSFNVPVGNRGQGLQQLGAGIQQLGQGLMQVNGAIEKHAAEESDARVNDAITRAIAAREAADLAHNDAILSAQTVEEKNAANTLYSKTTDDATADITKDLSADELVKFNAWSNRDIIPRNKTVESRNLNKTREINVKTTHERVNISSVNYTKNPSEETRKAYDESVAKAIDVSNLIGIEAAAFKEQKTKELHNQTVLEYINKERFQDAAAYLTAFESEFDAKSWSEFSSNVTHRLEAREVEAISQNIFKQATTLDVDGAIRYDYAKQRELESKISEGRPSSFRKKLKEQLQSDVAADLKYRQENSDEVYASLFARVEAGEIRYDQIPKSMLAAIATDDMQHNARNTSLRQLSDHKQGIEQQQEDQITKSELDSRSGMSYRYVMDYINDLNQEDIKLNGPALYTAKLNEIIPGTKFTYAQTLTQKHINDLNQQLSDRITGKESATPDEIVRVIGRKINDPDIELSSGNDMTKNISTYQDAILFVRERTRGVKADELPQQMREAVDIYFTKLKGGENLGAMLRQKPDGKGLILDDTQSVDRFNVNDARSKYGLYGTDDDSVRRVETLIRLRNMGAIPAHYRINKDSGKVEKIPDEDLLEGIKGIDRNVSEDNDGEQTFIFSYPR